MKRSPIWQRIAQMPAFDVVWLPHEHNGTDKLKCSTHQTLSANAHTYGYRLHVFHDGDELYVVKLPKEGRGQPA